MTVIGGGLAGCEAALQLARRGVAVTLVEMRPVAHGPRAPHGDRSRSSSARTPSRATTRRRRPGALKRELDVARQPRPARAPARPRSPPAARSPSTASAFAALVTRRPRARTRAIDGSCARRRSTLPAGPAIVATGPLTSRRVRAALSRARGRGAPRVLRRRRADRRRRLARPRRRASPRRATARAGAPTTSTAPMDARRVRARSSTRCSARRARAREGLRDRRAVPGVPAGRGGRAHGPRRAALRRAEARRPDRPAHGPPPVGGRAAARRRTARGTRLQPRRVPDEPHLPRAAPRLPADPGTRATPSSCATASCTATRSSTRRGCSTPDLALRDATRASRLAGQLTGHRGLPRGGRRRPSRGARHVRARSRASPPVALPAETGLRRARRVRDRPGHGAVPADARQLRHRPAARSARARQARPLRGVRRARRERALERVDRASRPDLAIAGDAPRRGARGGVHDRPTPTLLVDRFLTHLAAERGALARDRARVRVRPRARTSRGRSARRCDPIALDHRELRRYLAELRRARYARADDRAPPLGGALLLRLPRRARGSRPATRPRSLGHAEAARRGCPSSSRPTCSPRCSTRRTPTTPAGPARRARSSNCSTRPALRVGEVESLDLGGLDLAQGQVRVMGKGEQGADRADPPHGVRRSCGAGCARDGPRSRSREARRDAVFLNRLGHAATPPAPSAA